jgi:hypothetical protein
VPAGEDPVRRRSAVLAWITAQNRSVVLGVAQRRASAVQHAPTGTPVTPRKPVALGDPVPNGAYRVSPLPSTDRAKGRSVGEAMENPARPGRGMPPEDQEITAA